MLLTIILARQLELSYHPNLLIRRFSAANGLLIAGRLVAGTQRQEELEYGFEGGPHDDNGGGDDCNVHFNDDDDVSGDDEP